MNLIDEILNDATGAAILKDWIGEGVPVSQETANARAMVCLHGADGRECPHHIEAGWWDRIKHSVAFAIQQQIALKAQMNLETPYDKDLKMCGACGCGIITKVWVPIKHVKEHTPQAMIDKMPVFCWQRREMELA